MDPQVLGSEARGAGAPKAACLLEESQLRQALPSRPLLPWQASESPSPQSGAPQQGREVMALGRLLPSSGLTETRTLPCPIDTQPR